MCSICTAYTLENGTSRRRRQLLSGILSVKTGSLAFNGKNGNEPDLVGLVLKWLVLHVNHTDLNTTEKNTARSNSVYKRRGRIVMLA